ncbi:MAG: hypothetical protein K9J17_12205 [Flavobacteriales bacterium]|nr:hypothetical protein [Flavobacteriales bacterium]
MKKLVCLFIPTVLLLSSFGPTATVEDHNYQVLLDGKPIGTYTANRTEVNGTVNFRVETKTAAGLIRPSEHKLVLLTSYSDSKLISSTTKTWIDETLETSFGIQWEGDRYITHQGEDEMELCKELVSYSSACVYFDEPIGRSTIFNERYAMDLEVVDLGDHRYEMILPDGGKERYAYKNGKVIKAELMKSFTTITLNVLP